MKLSKTLAIPLVGALLVIGTGAVVAATGVTPPAGEQVAQNAAPTATPAPSAGTTTKPVKQDTALSDVLDGLVAKGTITAAQKTAILDALAAERTARQQQRQADRQQLRTFLADGVITQEEFNQLPADSPLRQMTNLMADGKITLQELQALGRGWLGVGRGGHGGMGGMRGGKGGWGAPAPSPTPSAGTSG